MHKCFECSDLIDHLTQSVCLYKKKYYHAACCQFCQHKNEAFKELSPSMMLKASKVEAKKAKLGPGKLNFNKLGTFEKNNDVNCKGLFFT